MGVWLKRRLDEGELEAAEWRVENIQKADISTDAPVVTISCPGCGVSSALTHEVAPNGAVVGIWPCPNEACPASDYLLLDGWDE